MSDLRAVQETPAGGEGDIPMHRTDTLDCFVLVRGELYLVSDTDEVLLRPGDTAVVRGVNHAWSNRSKEPALIIGVMTHAKPLPKERYPAEGL